MIKSILKLRKNSTCKNMAYLPYGLNCVLSNYINYKENSGIPVNYQQPPHMAPQYWPPVPACQPRLSPYQPYLWPDQQPGPPRVCTPQTVQVICMINKIICSLNKFNFFVCVFIFCLWHLLLSRNHYFLHRRNVLGFRKLLS